MKMQRLSPVLIVDAIEPCLPFWTERLGFEVHASAGDEGQRVFVLLLRDEVQVMYQTRASLADDLPSLAEHRTSVLLYLSVDDLDAVDRATAGLPRIQERRTTFYGATEFAVQEPGGNIVLFAQHDG